MICYQADRNYQNEILELDDRQAIIDWLVWNDPNGVYTDEDSDIQGMPRLTLESAKTIMARQIAD